MQAIEFSSTISSTPAIPGESTCHPDVEALRMRALRRKARRISAYARFNVEMLNTLALQVESDLAALHH